MPTIQEIKDQINADIRDKTAPGSVTRANVADNLDAVLDYADQEDNLYLPLAGNSFETKISGDVFVADTKKIQILSTGNLVLAEMYTGGGGPTRIGNFRLRRVDSGVLTNRALTMTPTTLEILNTPSETAWFRLTLLADGLAVQASNTFPAAGPVIKLSFENALNQSSGDKTVNVPYDNGTLVLDAPSDGNAYVRKDGAWVDITTL